MPPLTDTETFPFFGLARKAVASVPVRACLLAAALALVEGCAAHGKEANPAGETVAVPPAREGGIERGGGADLELQVLRARAAELEAELSALKAASGAGTGGSAPSGAAPLPEVKDLLEMVGKADAPALSSEVEKLLLRGDEGFAVLHEFLHKADIDHAKIDAITHRPQLILGMLRVVALHPDEVARFSSYLMKATKDQPESWLRREMFNFLPVFINHHQGRYPRLRRDLEGDIIHQIEMGGAFLYKVSLAMRDLDFKPPAEVFYPILADPSKRESHGLVIEQLTARKNEGLQVLRRYLAEAKDFKTPTAGAVMQAVVRLEGDKPGGTVEKLLSSEDPIIRRVALFAYFGEPRGDADLPRVVEFLNSKEGTFAQKRSFISLLAQKNVDLFESFFAGPAAKIGDEQLKEALRRTAEAVDRRRAKEAAAAARKGSPSGQPAPPGPQPKSAPP